ncbi:MAG: NAD-glutamate dehydrogenase [Spirochaetes bacterium]|nr:NAD-glutamate dehydrogenase [Spirochaetota bacterium]
MKPIWKPDAAEAARFETELAALAEKSGKETGFLHGVVGLVLAESSLAPCTALSRLRWLLDPGDGVALTHFQPALDAPALAAHVIDPRELVLDFIHRKSSLSRELLGAIHGGMCRGDAGRDPRGPSSRLEDLTQERILQEMKWWIVDLKFPAYYFQTTPPAEIAKQILTNRLYEMQGADSESYARMKIHYRSPSGTSVIWAHRERVDEVEREIEDGLAASGATLDLAMYTHDHLHLFLLESGKAESSDGFEAALPASLRHHLDGGRIARYREIWERARAVGGMVVSRSRKAETGEWRTMFAFPRKHLRPFLSHVSRALARLGIPVTRKYCALFGGLQPILIISVYSLAEVPRGAEEEMDAFRLLGDNALAPHVAGGALSAEEADFLQAAALYTHQFLRTRDPAFDLLSKRFAGDGELQEVLRTLGRRMDKDRFPPAFVFKTLADHPELARALFALFQARLSPRGENGELGARERVLAMMRDLSLSHPEGLVFQGALAFAEAIERTNFFLPQKNALAFRMKRGFLAGMDYGGEPHGVFFIVGRNFLGFHVRFKEIARGGVRIVRSPTIEEYARNGATLFEECYHLASTQDKKNKDIPEGGAKGILLPAFGCDAPREVFQDYVDALLDLLLPAHADKIRGFQEEILFLGPDEGTADSMDWACERARDRGYRWWKGFTTGKSGALGGISHIDYGMTTHGVHTYVLCLLERLGLDEASLTKIQTGGPDGDLGGNEILLSRDRTLGVVDGDGVLFDPDGLDRGELMRLARERLASSHFDAKRLGRRGFKVGVKDRGVTLPDGTLVASGTAFRNQFHLDPRARADLFLPCGGRPRSIDSVSWPQLLDERGIPKFRWIVEGANLFLTQEARLQLEKRGVLVFKDSSTNKGGVTSSSLEVLVGLALTDAEFERDMVSAGPRPPAFRARYVAEIVERIQENALREFDCLWRMREKTGRPLSELSDRLSEKVNELTDDIEASDLFDDPALRRAMLSLHAPRCLVAAIGLEALQERLPVHYQRAILARAIASRFIYESGIEPGYEDYRRYYARLKNGGDAARP